MLFRLLCGLVALGAGSAFLMYHNTARKVVKVISVGNGGKWGTWGRPHFCAEGMYAIGYEMEIEAPQHALDDTALNGIMLRCESLNGSQYGGDVGSGTGVYGDWDGVVRCDNQVVHHFLTAFSLQVEPPQGGLDDTAANFVKFKCRGFDTEDGQYDLAHPPGQGVWGSYGGWSESCPLDSAICGLRTKVELPQGAGDDTSLNDVEFFCCSE